MEVREFNPWTIENCMLRKLDGSPSMDWGVPRMTDTPCKPRRKHYPSRPPTRVRAINYPQTKGIA